MIGRALAVVAVQFISDWKMPFFRGVIYFLIPTITSLYVGLADFNQWAAVPDLQWTRIWMSALVAGLSAVAGYLDASASKKKDELTEKEAIGTQTSFTKEMAKPAEPAKE